MFVPVLCLALNDESAVPADDMRVYHRLFFIEAKHAVQIFDGNPCNEHGAGPAVCHRIPCLNTQQKKPLPRLIGTADDRPFLPQLGLPLVRYHHRISIDDLTPSILGIQPQIIKFPDAPASGQIVFHLLPVNRALPGSPLYDPLDLGQSQPDDRVKLFLQLPADL